MRARRLQRSAAIASAMLSAMCATARLDPTLAPRVVKVDVSLPAEQLDPNVLHDVVAVGNNWDGTATIFDPHEHTVITTVDIVPDLHDRMKTISEDPERARICTPEPTGCRGRPRSARGRSLPLKGRTPLVRVPAEPGRRRRHRSRDARSTMANRRRRFSGGPRCVVAGRRHTARVGDEGPKGSCDRHRIRQDRGWVPVRRRAAREEVLRRRHADLSREHRTRVPPDPLAAVATAQRGIGGYRSSTRRASTAGACLGAEIATSLNAPA